MTTLNFEDLETVFDAGKKAGGDGKPGKVIKEKICFIPDDKRAKNLNISLARYVRKGFEVLVENVTKLKWGFDSD